jgi:hypothetical protein
MIARINARLLDQYKGQTIRLTAKIIKLNGETATVEASDGGQVSLFLYSLFPIVHQFIVLLLSLLQHDGVSYSLLSFHYYRLITLKIEADIRSDFI